MFNPKKIEGVYSLIVLITVIGFSVYAYEKYQAKKNVRLDYVPEQLANPSDGGEA